MERDRATDTPSAGTGPPPALGLTYETDPARWRGMVAALSAQREASLGTAWLLLEVAAAGTLFEPLASAGLATWAGVECLAAGDELRRAELAWLPLPTPRAGADDGPVGRGEVRAVLVTAFETLGVCLPIAPDPAAVLRAQDRIRTALRVLADDA
ncbi:hypothetical protein I6A60_36950 [Frankia sp. AgB1.9]|uniref:hypothetical protein n=1 Tax=unclassified Frankia TaxID=2632575 RepID=UPI0019313E3F|nr:MULTISPECIES: hypothetical protein [unclassified Frankia]MBL7491385.1 hypothetical protein [Frankia sp. AgW1.1]MBL7553398.1 hypothetical protein [Frankia sp. AgB1.9]MBL7617855.1 hypothetical protein [Frankia sp. AgB1.8]